MFFLSSKTIPLCSVAFLAVLSGGVALAQEEAPVPAETTAAVVPDQAKLAESLAKANEEAATLREENERLRLQTEALGLAGLKPELRSLQERIIALYSAHRLADQKVKDLTDRVVNLSEAALALLGDASDPVSRERFQKELTAANQSLIAVKAAETAAAPVALESAKVISLKNDLGLAVINTGTESGLRLGTPMRLVRGEKTVATGLVVDVRSRIAGVLMTSPDSSGALRVGDQAKPETISTLK